MYREIHLSHFNDSLLLKITRFFADMEGTCLLFSGGSLDTATHSFLGLFPTATISIYEKTLKVHKSSQKQDIQVNQPWIGLEEHFFQFLIEDPLSMVFGWFGYGMGAFADPQHPLPYRATNLPDAYWEKCAMILILDRVAQQATVRIDASGDDLIEPSHRIWLEKLSTPSGWKDLLASLPNILQNEKTIFSPEVIHDPQRYHQHIKRICDAQELIREGEIYQVNLSQLFECSTTRHPFDIFQEMSLLNPASFFVYFHHASSYILSSSPERFLCKKGQTLETRPIKGTAQRGKTEEEDHLLKQHLLSSAKERAELLMITDLMRNDLGKVSEIGSVKVKRLWACEAYTNVFHLLSVIQSIAKHHLKPLEIVQSCFPGGSITGCPKLRAMEVIDFLENRPRGIYTGSIGYFTGTGDFDLNIAIRTLVIEKESASFQLGGGIVIDSNPHHEYEETLIKGATLFRILQNKE